MLKMSEEEHGREVLRSYLLGELSESERSQLADRYFVDEDLFDELLEVENELLDQYVRGRMPPRESKSFREYLTSLPDSHTKLATAFVLNDVRNQIPASTVVPSVIHSPWENLRVSLSARRPFLQYATVAIVIGLFCGLAYLIISQRALRRDLEQMRAKAEQQELHTAQQVRTAQENEQVLRDRNLQLEHELTQLKKGVNQQQNQNKSVVATLVLTPALRSSGTSDSLTISAVTKTILLILPIPQNEQVSNYSVILKTTRGQLVWSDERVKPNESRQGRTISLRLPAARLDQSMYKLTLLGKTVAEVDVAHDFYFNVVKE